MSHLCSVGPDYSIVCGRDTENNSHLYVTSYDKKTDIIDFFAKERVTIMGVYGALITSIHIFAIWTKKDNYYQIYFFLRDKVFNLNEVEYPDNILDFNINQVTDIRPFNKYLLLVCDGHSLNYLIDLTQIYKKIYVSSFVSNSNMVKISQKNITHIFWQGYARYTKKIIYVTKDDTTYKYIDTMSNETVGSFCLNTIEPTTGEIYNVFLFINYAILVTEKGVYYFNIEFSTLHKYTNLIEKLEHKDEIIVDIEAIHQENLNITTRYGTWTTLYKYYYGSIPQMHKLVAFQNCNKIKFINSNQHADNYLIETDDNAFIATMNNETRKVTTQKICDLDCDLVPLTKTISTKSSRSIAIL